MRSAILIDHSEIEVGGDDDQQAKEAAVEEAVAGVLGEGTSLGSVQVEDINVSLGCVRDDWEEGDPCPECGSAKISVMNLSEDRYESEGGQFNFMQKGDAMGPDTSYICGNCTTFLRYRAPNE